MPPIYDGDQQTAAPGMVNGTTVAMTAAVVKATVSGGATAYLFTAAYTTHNPVLNGSPLSYRKGVSYQLDAALRTMLLAAGAPMVAL